MTFLLEKLSAHSRRLPPSCGARLYLRQPCCLAITDRYADKSSLYPALRAFGCVAPLRKKSRWARLFGCGGLKAACAHRDGSLPLLAFCRFALCGAEDLFCLILTKTCGEQVAPRRFYLFSRLRLGLASFLSQHNAPHKRGFSSPYEAIPLTLLRTRPFSRMQAFLDAGCQRASGFIRSWARRRGLSRLFCLSTFFDAG